MSRHISSRAAILLLALLLTACGGGGSKRPVAPALDTDGDGQIDAVDDDDDNDGVIDILDSFPLDANEWVDTDSDGIGNNADVEAVWDDSDWEDKDWD